MISELNKCLISKIKWIEDVSYVSYVGQNFNFCNVNIQILLWACCKKKK